MTEIQCGPRREMIFAFPFQLRERENAQVRIKSLQNFQSEFSALPSQRSYCSYAVSDQRPWNFLNWSSFLLFKIEHLINREEELASLFFSGNPTMNPAIDRDSSTCHNFHGNKTEKKENHILSRFV